MTPNYPNSPQFVNIASAFLSLKRDKLRDFKFDTYVYHTKYQLPMTNHSQRRLISIT